MTTKALRIGISTIVVASALTAVIAFSANESSAFYKHVDEVMPQAQQWYGKPMKLHGFVDGDVLLKKGTLEYKFSVKYGEFTVPATYTGTVPDNFKKDAEVVLTGNLFKDGFHVEKDGITAKCPSRYEPADGKAGR